MISTTARPLRVLLIFHSLSGETNAVVKKFGEGLVKGVAAARTTPKGNPNEASELPPVTKAELTMVPLQTNPPFRFPWSFNDFFDVMPEAMYPSLNKVWNTRTIEPPPASVYDKNSSNIDNNQFDLVVLGWQTWYLSPSIPVRLALLYSPEYQALLRQGPVLLLGTHRNMLYRASRTLRRELDTVVGATVVGSVDFVQQATFLQSAYNTVRWQLGGAKGSAGIKESVQDEAFQYGMEYGEKLEAATRKATTATTTGTTSVAARASALGWYEAGDQHSYAIDVAERLWLPVKLSVAALMGKFRPGSLPRKAITVIYTPVLLTGLVVFGTPTVAIGKLVETLVRRAYKSVDSANKKLN